MGGVKGLEVSVKGTFKENKPLSGSVGGAKGSCSVDGTVGPVDVKLGYVADDFQATFLMNDTFKEFGFNYHQSINKALAVAARSSLLPPPPSPPSRLVPSTTPQTTSPTASASTPRSSASSTPRTSPRTSPSLPPSALTSPSPSLPAPVARVASTLPSLHKRVLKLFLLPE